VESRKFYVTPNQILDVEIVGDVRYHEAGSPTGMTNIVLVDSGEFEVQPDTEAKSWLTIGFKDPDKEWITLHGDEADTAWKNFRRAANIEGEAVVMGLNDLDEMRSKS
jgi:hypothetical protein